MYRGIYGFVSLVVSFGSACLPLYTFDSLPDTQTKRLVDSKKKRIIVSIFGFNWKRATEDKKEAFFPHSVMIDGRMGAKNYRN